VKLPGWPMRGRDRGWNDDAGDPAVRSVGELAEGPLSPDADALARMRATSIAAFREAAGTAGAAKKAGAPAVVPAARSVAADGRHGAPLRFRFAAAGLAVALLTVSGVGFAAAESGPGQPFYRARLTVESLFLPPAGSDARLDADLDRAQARLDEALAAASRSDWNAEADAMGAYVDVVASISVPGEAAAAERMQQRLGQQLASLQQMHVTAQGGARQEIGRAIDSVDSVMRRAGGSPSPGPMGSPNGQQATQTPAPSSGNQGGQGGQGGPSGGGSQGAMPSPSSGPMGSTGPMGSGQGGASSSGQGGGPGQGGAGGAGQGGPGGPGN
jgi:hypothetical protein